MKLCGTFLGIAALMFATTVTAADNDYVGDWKWDSEFQGNSVTQVLHIESDADGNMNGTISGRRGPSELSNFKLGDDVLTFDRVLERQGQSFTLSYSVKIADGKLEGTMSTPRGDREFVAMRDAGKPSFIGEWDVTLNLQGREIKGKLDLKKAEEKLTGTWTSQRGTDELKNIKIAENSLTFDREMSAQGQEVELNYAAKIDTGKLVGTITSPMGELPFEGIRIEKKPEETDRVTQMMTRMDSDGDGKIQESEAPEQMQQFFGMIDANGDGDVDKEELAAMIEQMGQRGGGN